MSIYNPATGETPSPKNAQTLTRAMSAKGYSDPQWATYNQWRSLGRQVQRGEKSTRITAPRGRDGDTGRSRFGKLPMFNIAQTKPVEGAEPDPVPAVAEAPSAPVIAVSVARPTDGAMVPADRERAATAGEIADPSPVTRAPRKAAAKRARKPRKKAPPRVGMLAEITAQLRANAREHDAIAE